MCECASMHIPEHMQQHALTTFASNHFYANEAISTECFKLVSNEHHMIVLISLALGTSLPIFPFELVTLRCP